MHPQIIGRCHRIRMLEDLIRYIRARSGLALVRHIGIAEMWLQRQAQ